jgi:hypothetical protein
VAEDIVDEAATLFEVEDPLPVAVAEAATSHKTLMHLLG